MAEYISFQPSDFYSTKLYTGTGSSLATTGVGFQPDFTWIKNRDAADFHVLTDSVRGVTKYLISDATTASTTNAESLKSFDSDGFTVGTQNEVNTNTEDYVSWNWKAGTTTGLTGGTITPSAYSINTTSKFSIIQYEGTSSTGTIPHGLGAAPKFIIFKNIDRAIDWAVYHYGTDATAPADYYTKLNLATARTDNASWFDDTAPTSTVFTIGGGSWEVNKSGETIIAYCFADVQGYSKFGSYTGNGNADGPFIYTGFRPAFIMFKKTDAVGEWVIYDTKRLGYNGANSYLEPSTTDDDDGNDQMDFLSNGVKIRNPGSYSNTSSGSYIYAAFAEFPLVSSNDTPTVAR